MIIYDKIYKSGKSSVEIEVKAFFDMEDSNLTVTQCLFDGPKVISHSTVTLSPEEYNKIVNVANAIYVKSFLNLYKLEG